MSDEYANSPPDPRIEVLGRVFSQLAPEDQDLVFALVTRLRAGVTEEEPAFKPDVPFMDFEE